MLLEFPDNLSQAHRGLYEIRKMTSVLTNSSNKHQFAKANNIQMCGKNCRSWDLSKY